MNDFPPPGAPGCRVPLKFLSRALDRNLLAHAYLLAGPQSETHGRILSCLLLCHSPLHRDDILVPCGSCTGCRKAQKGVHPDFIVVEPDGTMIKVNQIRELHKNLSYPPLEWKRKVCLILKAHRMNLEAENALLKTLEEPPDRTHIILATHSTMELLPTVISRCQLVRCPPLSPENMRDMIPEESGNQKLFFYVSGGDYDIIQALDTQKVLEIRDGILELKRLRHPLPAVFRLADAISADRETSLLFIQIQKTIIRDIMVMTHDNTRIKTDNLINSDAKDLLQRIAGNFSFRDLDTLSSHLYAAETLIERNINLNLLVLGLLLRWLNPGLCTSNA